MKPTRKLDDVDDHASERAGLPAPDPDNDVAPTLVHCEVPAPEPRRPRWPLIVIGLGGLLTILWTALLGWGAFKLAGAILP